jgi:hypothetical protein
MSGRWASDRSSGAASALGRLRLHPPCSVPRWSAGGRPNQITVDALTDGLIFFSVAMIGFFSAWRAAASAIWEDGQGLVRETELRFHETVLPYTLVPVCELVRRHAGFNQQSAWRVGGVWDCKSCTRIYKLMDAGRTKRPAPGAP